MDFSFGCTYNSRYIERLVLKFINLFQVPAAGLDDTLPTKENHMVMAHVFGHGSANKAKAVA